MELREVAITTEFIKLEALLKFEGTMRGRKLRSGDEAEMDGVRLKLV